MSIKSKFSKLSIALLSGAALGAAVMVSNNTSASADEIYTVKAGDTLSQISYDFNLNGDYNSIAKANNISDVNFITVGQKLVITNGGQIRQATKSDEQKLPEVNQPTVNKPAASTQNTAVQAPVQKQSVKQAPVAQAAPVKQAAAPVQQASGNEASAKEWIASRESGGSYSARNGRYVGRYQLDASYLNGDYSQANQERVADNYVHSRYGSWSNAQAAWQAKGWY